jgi:hypothetical protein
MLFFGFHPFDKSDKKSKSCLIYLQEMYKIDIHVAKYFKSYIEVMFI